MKYLINRCDGECDHRQKWRPECRLQFTRHGPNNRKFYGNISLSFKTFPILIHLIVINSNDCISYNSLIWLFVGSTIKQRRLQYTMDWTTNSRWLEKSIGQIEIVLLLTCQNVDLTMKNVTIVSCFYIHSLYLSMYPLSTQMSKYFSN